MPPRRVDIPNQRGFALVLALLIVALLVVVLVGAAMLVRVETLTSSNSQKTAEARQNAIYGLEVALADLQELAGPDQRVTATAELNRNGADPLWSPSYLTGGTASNPATTPARNWTGVWDVSRSRYIPDVATPGRVTPNVGDGGNQLSAKPLKWLVSGGQRKSGGTESQTSNVSPLGYTAVIGADGSLTGVNTPSDHVVLLGSGTVDLAVSAGADGVAVPKVPIFNPLSTQPTNPCGAYAFWVGDEGVKAKFQDGAESASFETTYASQQRDLLRLSAPQKLGIGAIVGTNTATLREDGYFPSDPEFLAALRRLHSDEQIGYLPGGEKLGPDFKRRFHDLTLYSRGVLADVKKGGLKQDLTVFLQQGDISGKIRDTDLFYEDSRDDPSSTDPVNPRAPFRIRFPGFHPTSNSGLPRIGLLRSWYGMTTPTVRPHTDTQHGVFPVISRCEWPVWLKMSLDLSKATYPYAIPLTAFELRIFPTITLYNPYNTDLPGVDYTVTLTIGANAAFELRSDTNTSGQPIKFDLSGALGGDKMIFKIPAGESGLRAGESKIFTLRDTDVPYSSSMEMVSDYVTETPGFGAGLTYPNNPNGGNPNSYFKIGGTYANASDPLKITKGSGTLAFQYILFRPSSPPNTALPRLTELSVAGGVLQSITDAPANHGWVSFGGAAVNRMVFSAIQYTGANIREIDTRRPVGAFNMRPLTHRATTSVDPVGGSLAPVTGYNLRAALDAPAPAIWLGGFGESRYWGTKRNLPDGTTSIVIRGYSPPILSGGSPAYERFPYTWQSSPSGPAQEVSGVFSASDLGLSAPLFSLRSDGLEPLSLAEFQHVNLAGHAWQPSYVLGNSFVDPKLKGRDCYAGFFRYGDAGAGIEYFTRTGVGNPANSAADTSNRVYDASWMANDALWDRFFLSGANTSAPQAAGILSNKRSLPNSRLTFRLSNGRDYNSLGSPAEKLERGASFLLNDGAFNVNSTSVEAWKAILSSRLGLKINNDTAGATEAVFARMLDPGNGDGTFFAPPPNQPAAERAGAYTGARRLTADEVQVLAEEIVKQVKHRGPFTSISDFVNRRLTTELTGPPFNETEISRTGFSGALQAAIDSASDRLLGYRGINSPFYSATLRGSFYKPEKIQVFPGGAVGIISDVNIADSSLWGAVVPRLAMLGRPWYYTAAGLPGFITQADLLQAIGPLLTTRSDTFRIRAYGEVRNPRTGKIESRAWCEAIVQRMPDPLGDNPTADDMIWPERPGAVANKANTAGRRFEIVAFRWLAPEEV